VLIVLKKSIDIAPARFALAALRPPNAKAWEPWFHRKSSFAAASSEVHLRKVDVESNGPSEGRLNGCGVQEAIHLGKVDRAIESYLAKVGIAFSVLFYLTLSGLGLATPTVGEQRTEEIPTAFRLRRGNTSADR